MNRPTPSEPGTDDTPVLLVDVTDAATSAGSAGSDLRAPDATTEATTEEALFDASSAAEDDAESGLDLDALPGGARGALEAVLMVVEEPVDEVALGSALGLPVDQVETLLADLVDDYDACSRGFELRRVAGGWRIFSRAAFAPVVERFVLDGQTARLTQAALETLAIVAYRQPVSRARVGAVRGVNVDAVMRTLTTRGLVEEAGNDPETGAVLYRTTNYFLQRIGLSSIDDLPALAPYLPEADVLDELVSGGVL